MKNVFAYAAIAATVTCVSLPVRAPAASDVDIVASMGKFSVTAITMTVGQTTTLHLTSTEGTHYLKSDELGIPFTAISPGSHETLAVTPKKAGTYVLHCAMYCGPGHQNMVIVVTVRP